MVFEMVFDQPISELMKDDVAEGSTSNVSSFPPLDIAEYENETKVIAEMPGVKRGDLKISVEGGWLKIQGERKTLDASETKRVLHREIVSQVHSRSVKLPHRVKVDAISATLEDGMLEITLPKADEDRPRTIEIN
jgi:HSP20 family protein